MSSISRRLNLTFPNNLCCLPPSTNSNRFSWSVWKWRGTSPMLNSSPMTQLQKWNWGHKIINIILNIWKLGGLWWWWWGGECVYLKRNFVAKTEDILDEKYGENWMESTIYSVAIICMGNNELWKGKLIIKYENQIKFIQKTFHKI